MRGLLTLAILLISSASLFAQINSEDKVVVDKIVKALTKEGFENVEVALSSRKLVVGYENRRYRFEVTGLAAALKILSNFRDYADEVMLILKSRGIPLTEVSLKFDDYLAFTEGRISTTEFSSKIEVSCKKTPEWTFHRYSAYGRANSSYGKLDIVLSPGIAADLAQPGKWLRLYLDLISDFYATIARGSILALQLKVPLKEDLGPYRVKKSEPPVKLGRVVLGIVERFPNEIFASIGTGFFGNDRYGLVIDAAKLFNNGNLYLGGSFGYAGSIYYTKTNNVLYYSKPKVKTYTLESRYRFPKVDLMLGASWGQFFYGDKGWEFILSRSFNETYLGFTGTKTQGAWIGKVRVGIPIFPPTRQRPRRARVRTPNLFSVNYRYETYENLVQGERLQTGFEVDRFLGDTYPVRIKNNIEVLRKF